MLEDWLRSPPFRYSLTVPPDQGANALLDFLTKTQAGFCQQFATAFAVLAREVGLPSRVAVGFTEGDPDSQGLYHVTDADAHAWPEVWFSGIGWVAFEPTPGRGSPDPNAQAVTGVHPSQFESGTTPTTTAGTTPTTAPRSQPTLPSGHVAAGPQGTSGASHHSSWVVALLLAIGSLAAAAVVWAVALALLAKVVVARRRRHARTAAARVSLAWSLAREALAVAGLPSRAWETPSEYAERAALAALPESVATAVARLAELEERASYSVAGPGDGDVDAAAAAEQEVLRAARARGRDPFRPWDPRPLITSLCAARAEARAARANQGAAAPEEVGAPA